MDYNIPVVVLCTISSCVFSLLSRISSVYMIHLQILLPFIYQATAIILHTDVVLSIVLVIHWSDETMEVEILDILVDYAEKRAVTAQYVRSSILIQTSGVLTTAITGHYWKEKKVDYIHQWNQGVTGVFRRKHWQSRSSGRQCCSRANRGSNCINNNVKWHLYNDINMVTAFSFRVI